jgi:hypothetical protein
MCRSVQVFESYLRYASLSMQRGGKEDAFMLGAKRSSYTYLGTYLPLLNPLTSSMTI